MKRMLSRALLLPTVVLMAPSPARTTTALDEAVAEAIRMGRDAAAEAAALPGVAAPPPAAEAGYEEVLSEPRALESALKALGESSAPPRPLPRGVENGLTGNGAPDRFLLEPPSPGFGAEPPELLPDGLRSELGLPAPIEVAPR